jgi:N-acetylmuramoyl-L-alanine amidase CwlA
MTYLETRLKQVEKDLNLKDKAEGKTYFIFKEFGETTKEAKAKYELKNKVKIKDNDDLIIFTWVKTREQAEQLKKDK